MNTACRIPLSIDFDFDFDFDFDPSVSSGICGCFKPLPLFYLTWVWRFSRLQAVFNLDGPCWLGVE